MAIAVVGPQWLPQRVGEVREGEGTIWLSFLSYLRRCGDGLGDPIAHPIVMPLPYRKVPRGCKHSRGRVSHSCHLAGWNDDGPRTDSMDEQNTIEARRVRA